jgi:hypothetical protein
MRPFLCVLMLLTVAAIATGASAAFAAPMFREGGFSMPLIREQQLRLIPNKPPPVNGYRGPNGPLCHQVCIGPAGGGSPQRPAPCQWQTVCN